MKNTRFNGKSNIDQQYHIQIELFTSISQITFHKLRLSQDGGWGECEEWEDTRRSQDPAVTITAGEVGNWIRVWGAGARRGGGFYSPRYRVDVVSAIISGLGHAVPPDELSGQPKQLWAGTSTILKWPVLCSDQPIVVLWAVPSTYGLHARPCLDHMLKFSISILALFLALKIQTYLLKGTQELKVVLKVLVTKKTLKNAKL